MKKGCLCVIGIVFLLFTIGKCSESTNKKNIVDETEASVISESFLKALMKFPDDVEFIKSSKNVIEESGKIFKVTGHLKANNSFGQAVPYTYNIRIKYNGGDWAEFREGLPANWNLVSGNLYNEVTQQFTEF